MEKDMNSVVHFELPADDMNRAGEFYKKAFGWEVNKVPMEGVEYSILMTTPVDEKRMPTKAGAINGGMMPRNIPGEGTMIVVDVPSMEEALMRIQELGGRIVLPSSAMGGMGLYARIQDTEGNIIGIWQNLPQSHA